VSVGGYGSKQADSRDLIITQLKREINDIKTAERDIVGVNSQLSTIEHKYRLLQDEKNIIDREYKARSENNMRRIAQLKSEEENFARKLTAKSKEYENLLQDLKEMEHLGNFKQQTLEGIQNNLREAGDLKRNLEQEINLLRRKIKKETDSKSEVVDRIDIGSKKLDDLISQNKECCTEIAGLEEELRLKSNQEAELDKSLGLKNKELAIATDLLSQVNNQIEDMQQTIDELEQERNNRRKDREDMNSKLAALKPASTSPSPRIKRSRRRTIRWTSTSARKTSFSPKSRTKSETSQTPPKPQRERMSSLRTTSRR
jgi:chromosome segregation ATPase